MSKRINLPAIRRHVEIYEEDWLFLEQNFGKHTSNPVGVGPAIRQIVHAKVKGLRAAFEAKLDSQTQAETQANAKLAAAVRSGAGS